METQTDPTTTAAVDQILCPVDFDAPSRKAAVHAAELARELDAELTLLHVRPDTAALPLGGMAHALAYSPERQRLAEEAERNAEAELELMARVLADDGLRVDTRVVRRAGSIARSIVREAQDAQLLVVGSHGRRGFRRFLFGSVAEQVARRADHPVLIVPEESR